MVSHGVNIQKEMERLKPKPVIMSQKKLSFNGFSAFALLVCISFGAMKMRAYLPEGRFWAEEGAIFYSSMINLEFWKRPLFIFNGHLEFITNIIVTCATLVEPRYAPMVTTYLAYAAQLIPICIIITYRETLGLSEWKLITLIIISVGLPQASEVWANTTNLHFHFALVAALIASLPTMEGPKKHTYRLALLASGLSGIPANFVLPALIANAIKEGTSERRIQMGIISATTALQVGLLLTNDFESAGRTYTFNPITYWLAGLSQTIVAPLFGLEVGNHISQILRSAHAFNINGLLFAGAITLLPAHLALTVLRHPSSTHKTLLICSLLLSIMCTLTSLGSKIGLISAFYGGRYFYASNVLLAACLLGTMTKLHRPVIAVTSIVALTSLSNIPHYLGGPSWSNSLSEAHENQKTQVKIWPQGWTMLIPANNKP